MFEQKMRILSDTLARTMDRRGFVKKSGTVMAAELTCPLIEPYTHRQV